MRRELLVPKLGLTMTEGVLVEWMVAPGEPFKSGQGIFVIESEKAASEIAAENDGTLLETAAELGASLQVGTVIGYWEDGTANAGVAAPPATASAVVQGTATAAFPRDPTLLPAGARMSVTPLARRIAQQRGIDLSRISGSGPRGRIRARDLPDAPPCATIAAVTAASQMAAPTVDAGAGTLRRPNATELAVARRLTASKQEIPHFYLAVEAEVSRLLALRAEFNAAQSGIRLTLNHFILAAVGRALEEMPQLNRVWTADGILSLAASDVGMAVSTARGLTVPVLRDLGRASLGQIADQATSAIERAQAGRLAAVEMAGGAITVSNAGMHDVTYISSIINPGQAMILGVGSVRELFRPDAAGQPALRREIGLVLSADHRVLDGVSALAFLRCVVDRLERPLGLMGS